jgi:hypothetical protein
MDNWIEEISTSLQLFEEVAGLARFPFPEEPLRTKFLSLPHDDKEIDKLADGETAVYGFNDGRKWLKIGQAGRKSWQRYRYQHYKAGSAKSNLADSLIKHHESNPILGFNPDDHKSWILSSTNRVNIVLPPGYGRMRHLLEAFLIVRLNPLFEGTQKE